MEAMEDSVISAGASAVIDRPIEDVFAFASDQQNEPGWHTDVLAIRPAPASAGAGGLGSRWLVTVGFFGRNEYEVEVTGIEPNRLVEITTRSGPLRPITTYAFEPAELGTRFYRQVEIPLEGKSRILKPLLARVAERRNARFVENLKNVLERRGHSETAHTEGRSAP